MRTLTKTLILGASLACSGLASAGSWSIAQPKSRFLPVLIQVNEQGAITNVSPAEELPPRVDRLLRQNLDEMISGPAKLHHQAVASQAIITVALSATKRPSGDYSAHFAYVGKAPVPAGSWFWLHLDGNRLVLASQDRLHRLRPSVWAPPTYYAINRSNQATAASQAVTYSSPLVQRTRVSHPAPRRQQ
jgi:hypothetical protein